MRYEPIRGGRLLIPLMFVAFALAGVALVIATIVDADNGPPVVFTIFWIGAAMWNAYWWLTRIAVELQLEEGVLLWRTPLATGRTSVHALTEIRPMRVMSNIEMFVHEGGRPVVVMATKGLRAFLAEVSRLRPELPVRVGWQARLAERMPGGSRFRRE